MTGAAAIREAILPTPRRVLCRRAAPFRYDRPPDVAAVDGAGCGIAPAWLARMLGSRCRGGGAQATFAIDASLPLAAADHDGGYRLTVDASGIAVRARTPGGLLCGAASVAQLVQCAGAPGTIPACVIDDRPDVRFRVADWLLNLEINRWGYERGDGRTRLLARLKRKIDQAVRFKLNTVWFDGFGWDADRAPGYAAFVGALSDYARQRHVRLAFAGYGGGYGIAYQKGYMYETPYHGEVFRNRRRYPAGAVYPCVGHPGHPESRTYGTCLANAALQRRKLAELTRFVRACRPGMLYIHDIDAGHFEAARRSWMQRCPACRRRWPSDAMTDPAGAAGAYAAWFRQVAAAVGAVRAPGTGYRGDRDCELLFVGPVYTGVLDADELWERACDYFVLLSRLIGPAANVQFGIREQLVSDAPEPGPRVARLRRRLDAVGHGHGVFVVSFCGGDNFFNDQPVSPAAALQRAFDGARTVYTAGLGALAEPGQVVAAQFGWNGGAPGAPRLWKSRGEALALRSRVVCGAFAPDALYGRRGLLRRACEHLYGKAPAAALARAFALSADPAAGAACGYGSAAEQRRTRLFPLFCLCGFASGDVARLAAAAAADEGAHGRGLLWRTRETLTARALAYLATALRRMPADAAAREDVAWLLTCARVGRAACRALSAAWEWRDGAAPAAATRLRRALAALDDAVRPAEHASLTDPAGGDLSNWILFARRLREAVQQN